MGPEAEELVVAVSLWKILRFLANGLRLRTACDLKAGGLRVAAPLGFEVPSLEELEAKLPGLMEKCSGLFADPGVTEIKWEQ